MAKQARSFHFISKGRVPEGISLAIKDAVQKAEGKRLVLTLAEDKKASSDPQRRYYFAVIVESIRTMFLEHGTNLTKEQMHRWMKKHIGNMEMEVITPDGEITTILRSYTDLTTMEAEVYHTECRKWAAERGCQIPEPNESTNPEE